MEFNYYYGNQADQFSFIRIPRVLLVDPLFEPLTIQAKLLYGVLLDRMGVSMRNGWFDEKNRVYIIYQISEIQTDLGFSKKKSIDYLTELEQFGLVEKKRRGRGLPSILYVKSFMVPGLEARSAETDTSTSDTKDLRSVEMGTSASDAFASRSAEIVTSRPEEIMDLGGKNTENTAFSAISEESRSAEIDTSTDLKVLRGSQIDTSRGSQIALLEVPKSTPLKNYNNINYTNESYNKSNHISSATGSDEDEMRKMHAYAELIAENMDLESLKQNHIYDADLLDGIYDLVLEVALCKSATMVIASNEYPTELVRSKFLTEDMADTAEHMVWMIRKVFNISCQASAEVDIGRVTNNSKVSDHHAIIPTVELEKQEFKELSKGEKDILLLISMRLLMATGVKQRISETEIRVSCGGEEFLAKGKNVLNPGWKEFEDHFRKMKNLTVSKAEKGIPLLSEGQTFVCENVSASQHFTSPPKTFTEDSLLSAMETAGNDSFDEDTEKKGLGTPATRAEMIEKLVRNSYVQRKGKQLIPTEDGMALVQILPEEVKSAKLTADWENALKQIEKGALSKEEFMSGITDMVKELVTKYGVTDGKQDNPFSGGDSTRPQREEIGKCPRCGSSVLEGEKGFYCNKRECSFCLWKENRWLSSMRKKLTKKMTVALLKDGRVHVTGLYSERKGRCFDADLLMKDDGERVNYSLDFSSKSTAKRKTKG